MFHVFFFRFLNVLLVKRQYTMNVKLKFGVFDLSKRNLDSGWIQ